jgi:hypothetical protein
MRRGSINQTCQQESGSIGPNGDHCFAVLVNSDGGHAEELLDHACSISKLVVGATVGLFLRRPSHPLLVVSEPFRR